MSVLKPKRDAMPRQISRVTVHFGTFLSSQPAIRIAPQSDGLSRKLSRAEEKMNIENEGESHDIVDNKGSNFLTHDVIDNKDSYIV
jgi:hypothetical protein